MNKNVTVRRLRVLAEHLKTVKSRKLAMGSWTDADTYTEKAAVEEIKNPECGTTACALGHAATIPSFRRAGLRFKINEYREGGVFFGNEDGIDAAVSFFGIHWEDAFDLFMPSSYENPTKRNVINRLNRLANKIEKGAK